MGNAGRNGLDWRPGDACDIQFSINGKQHYLTDKYPATNTLNDYIRDVAGLKGTKVMCKEAGCGCCTVTVTHTGEGDKLETKSINSCLCPLYVVDGWHITTTEGLGDHSNGFHPIQDRMAKHNATQCGYCTPGFVMSMYGLLHQKPKITQQEIEDSLDGHICRCTGYRSILDAMKSFGSDSTTPETTTLDIEDLNKHLCPKTGEVCKGKESGSVCHPPTSLNLDLRESRWYRPLSLEDLGRLLTENKTQSVRMVFGNTASGIFKNEGPFQVYIDLHGVQELYQYKEMENGVIFGASTTLSKLKDLLKELQNKPGYTYFTRVVRHLKMLASVLVRNAGSIAGNLMIKHAHPEFPSDLFTIMEAIGASVEIYDAASGTTNKYSLLDFKNNINMQNKVLVSLQVPKFGELDNFRSFKVSPRWQNAHAYVNAAFKINVDNLKVTARPAFVVGGISAETVHANKAEEYITGKSLNEEVIQETLRLMASEMNPTSENVPISSAKYRKDVTVNLLYKILLELAKPTNPKIRSGADSLERPLSSGLQTFQEKNEEFPLKQAMPKVEAPLQASGETVYTNDVPSFRHELFGAYVLSTVGCGTLIDVDISKAMAIPGVVRYISAKDIPEGGTNVIMNFELMKIPAEELFATKTIEYAGQPIGIILAESQALAEEAVKYVKVTYSDVQKPVMYLEEAVDKGHIHDEFKHEKIVGNPDEAFKECEVVVTGEVKEGTQYHCHIENQVSVAVPTENSIDLYSAVQFADYNQRLAAEVINKPRNYINMIAPRVGGSFGGKGLYSASPSCAATLACYLTKRPVRIMLNLSSNMKICGKRFPIMARYKAGFDRDGRMKVIDAELFIDYGFKSGPMGHEFWEMIDQGYFVPNWKVHACLVKTNKASNQPCRGPGSVPAALVMETIMEHAAKQLDMHPILFKEINLYEKGQTDVQGVVLTECTLKDAWKRLKQTAHVDERMKAVETFNKSNRWRKRGITMTSVKYGIRHMPPGHTVHVSVFAGDGTVTVITSGVEMGQGLYTKISQAVAATLKIPLEYVTVRPGQNNVTPNPTYTGGSSGSEMCVSAAINACNQINERLKPYREKTPDAAWPVLLASCYYDSNQLSATALSDKPDKPLRYFTYCVGVVETEVDVLTGEYQVKRVDIMCDFGESINPTIDIGQVEGAFVMGLGAFLTEDIHYDRKTGEVLNDGTWEYKPPTSKDIPIDWRIHFLPDTPNKVGILSSKAVGEPPIGLSVGALLSIKSSVENLREELTGKKEFLPVYAPYTVEKVQLDTGIDVSHLMMS